MALKFYGTLPALGRKARRKRKYICSWVSTTLEGMPATITEWRALLPSDAAYSPGVALEIRRSTPFRAKVPPPRKSSLPAPRCSAAASGSGRGRDTKRERDENISGAAVFEGKM